MTTKEGVLLVAQIRIKLAELPVDRVNYFGFQLGKGTLIRRNLRGVITKLEFWLWLCVKLTAFGKKRLSAYTAFWVSFLSYFCYLSYCESRWHAFFICKPSSKREIFGFLTTGFRSLIRIPILRMFAQGISGCIN